MRQVTLVAVMLFSLCGAALASPPKVAADIAPVHSLVAEVMGTLGAPALIVPSAASPHGHNMRPSEAAALSAADLVVWMGPALTPWLQQAIENLAGGARSLVLLDVHGTTRLPYRHDPHFEPESAAQAEAHEHQPGEIDPHAWLDPENARLWLGAIAGALSEIDPENAAAYRTNAEAASERLAALVRELTNKLIPLGDRPFIVFHDAYQYFEHRFGLHAIGAISHGDAAPPGPRRISAMRKLIAETGAACVFAEPQFPSGLVATVTEGTAAKGAVLDPLGVTLQPGKELYPQLLNELAENLQSCLAPAG